MSITTSILQPSRVAIVGCGVISPAYVKTLGQLEQIVVAACVDQVAEKAEALAHTCGAKPAAFEEVLADPSIDAVVNLTPPLAHAAVTRAVLEAGKAAFSEKPLGVDFADGLALRRSRS